MSLIILGVNHNTAPLSVRENIATIVQNEEWLDKLIASSSIQELVVVSTCNRVEVYTIVADSYGLDGLISHFADSGVPVDTEQVYAYQSVDVVQHLFRVVCSLDSMILGETQILAGHWQNTHKNMHWQK